MIFSKILPEKTIFCIRTANCFGSLFGKVRHNSQLIPNLRSAIQQYSQICRNVEKFQVKKRKKLAKNRKKGLTFREVFAIIYEQRRESEEPSRREHGGIAQLARAFGSYPTGRWFKSDFRYQSFYDLQITSSLRRVWPVGQAVKTRPFHGCNMGSIPVRVTKRNKSELFRKSKLVRICFLLQPLRGKSQGVTV